MLGVFAPAKIKSPGSWPGLNGTILSESNDSTHLHASQFQTHLTEGELWSFRLEFYLLSIFFNPSWDVISFRFDEDGFLVSCRWQNFFGDSPFHATIQGLRKRAEELVAKASVELRYSAPAPKDDPNSLTWRAGTWMAFWQHALAGQPDPSVDACKAGVDFFSELAKKARNAGLLPAQPQAADLPGMRKLLLNELQERSNGPGRSASTALTGREKKIWDVIQRRAKGRQYCRELTNEQINPPREGVWHDGPRSYLAAFDLGQPWRKRIQDEKSKIAKKAALASELAGE
jgi:hypothetical protein